MAIGVIPMRHQKNWDANIFEMQVGYLGKQKCLFTSEIV